MESYNAKAVSFANTVDRKNGIVITFYKPKDGYDYYLREKRNKAR